MNSLKKVRRSIVYLSLIAALLLGSCARPNIQLPTATPVPPPVSQALLGDFGDAPDGDYNMDTGYYAFTGGPWVWTLSSAGIPADFPTMGRDQLPGPYMLDVDEFWIGPLLGFTDDSDIPSIEDDADDLNDPDGLANLLVNGTNADCDKENGSHNPSGNGCAPMAAYSMPMNARLLIFFGVPPLGIWITTIHASEDMSYNGPVYWNLLYDLDQDGEWEDGPEWVARDVLVDLEPGERETLISPAFRFPTSGTPWGRLRFPNWVRSMISSESMEDTFNGQHWDGRGIEGGFAVGEVEDYFVEWRPIGQRFPNQGGGGGAGEGPACQLSADGMLEEIPSSRSYDQFWELIPGDDVTDIEVLTGNNLENGGVVESSGPIKWDDDFEVPGLDLGRVYYFGDYTIRVEANPFSSTEQLMKHIVLFPHENRQECSGTGPVVITPGVWHVFTSLPPVSLTGIYSVTSMFHSGNIAHDPFALGSLIDSIFAQDGSITFSGDPPFVTVTGERNEADGSFFADGVGVVAGFPNIAVTFEGTIGNGEISGLYTMGAEGGLPGGESITYEIKGTKSEEQVDGSEAGPPPLAEGIPDNIQAFVDVFNGAFESGDPEPLYQLLHPAVGEIYGEEACLAYIEGIVSTPTNLEYLDASYVGKWEFERDGAVVPVDFAYAVQANFTANDQTNQQELHLVLPGDDSVRWFTDCGEPLAGE